MKIDALPAPALDDLNAMKLPEYARALAGILENSPHLAARTWYARPFETTEELHRAFTGTVLGLSEREQFILIRSQSDSFKKLNNASDTAAAAGRDSGEPTVSSAPPVRDLSRLHQRFIRRFGFPFIMRERGVTPAEMRAAMESRLTEERPLEMLTALDEICCLAKERIDEMFGA